MQYMYHKEKLRMGEVIAEKRKKNDLEMFRK